VAVIAVGAALAWFAAVELGRRLPRRPPPIAGWATAGVLVLAAIAAFVAAHPIRRFQAFKQPGHYGGAAPLVTQHLLSSSGSGRWQLWTEALSQFRAHPLNGGGGGSFLYAWLQHRPIPLYSLYAHSLYLEALGELGIVGLLLLAAAVLVAIVGAVRAARALRSAEVAGLAACGIAFFVAASYDWIWQLAGVTVVGVGALGLALGALPSGRATSWGRFGVVRPVLAFVAVAAIVPQVLLLAAALHLQRSQAAYVSGDLGRAKSEALAMKVVEPWAATPYFQLGLLDTDEEHLNSARAWFGSAIRRSREDWELWLYAGIVDIHRGHVIAAKREIDEARRLDPRAAVFQAGAS